MMIKNVLKALVLGVMMTILIPLPAFAGTPHTSWGIITSGTTGDAWSFYVVARPAEKLSGSANLVGGSFVWQAWAGNFPTAWNNGDDSLAFVKRETNPGTNSHTGYYAVMNEDLSTLTNPQKYNDMTIRQVPVPTATAAPGAVNLTWTAAAADTSKTPHGNNIAGYNVYRSTSQASGFTKINAALADTSYSDTTGVVGTTYYYAIEPVFRGSVVLGVNSANSNGAASLPVPGTLQLSAATYSVNENVGTATITVSRTGGSSGAVGVNYATSNGTATAGSDYTAASGTLNWADADAANKTFTVPIIDDAATEASETVNLTLSAPTGGATLGTPSTAVLTITDNDTPTGPSITQLERTSTPGVAITSADIGDGISIIGSNFGTTEGASTITINGTPVTTVYYWSATKIDLAVPLGATSGNVVVTVNGRASNGMPLTIGPAPSLSGINPIVGEQGQTLDMTLNFTNASWSGNMASKIHFSGTGITIISATGNGISIEASVSIDPAASADTRTVTVDGATGSANFTVVSNVGPRVDSITPVAAPAGTRVKVVGARFGTPQGRSLLNFNNLGTGASYTAPVLRWSDTTIEAIIPSAPAGSYEVRVIYIPSGSGLSAMESNPANFQVTTLIPSGTATIYPNPFNAGVEQVKISVTDTGGATNVGFYIFDMTARLVARNVVTSLGGTAKWTNDDGTDGWKGYDQTNSLVGDGAYIVRVINEDTKSVIAKGKVLVVKR